MWYYLSIAGWRPGLTTNTLHIIKGILGRRESPARFHGFCADFWLVEADFHNVPLSFSNLPTKALLIRASLLIS